ncbi:hypothetical protein BGX21_010233 [Mortierella sp. AD011]|nr:hypothetical protein BGX21_010233 [Mortierella sp. AD011]
MSSHILTSRLGISLATAGHLKSLAPFLTPSVSINLALSGYHLMTGLLLGVVKYYQIHNSKTYTAHPYISTAHRASLMYGFASFQLAGVSLLSSWEESVNVKASVAAQFFFVSAVLTYAIHGFLQDTTNQLRVPHKLGEKRTLPPWLTRFFMISLIVAEVVLLSSPYSWLHLSVHVLYLTLRYHVFRKGAPVPVPSTIANCTTQGAITLAFDGCPQVHINKLLDIIKDGSVKATSFVNGHNNDDIAEFAGVVKREYDEGHHTNLVALDRHL